MKDPLPFNDLFVGTIEVTVLNPYEQNNGECQKCKHIHKVKKIRIPLHNITSTTPNCISSVRPLQHLYKISSYKTFRSISKTHFLLNNQYMTRSLSALHHLYINFIKNDIWKNKEVVTINGLITDIAEEIRANCIFVGMYPFRLGMRSRFSILYLFFI